MTLTLSADSLRPVASLFRRLKIRTTLPILDHIRLTVTEGKPEVLLETTDLDVHLAVIVPIAGPTTPGSFTIPRVEFFQLAGKSDKGSLVRFESPMACDDAYAVHISSMTKKLRSDRTVTGLSPENFPPCPQIDGKPVIFPAASLDAIRRVRPATSADDTHYVLKGVFLTAVEGGNVVATDGRRLATSRARVPSPDSILPNAVADLLVDPLCQAAAIWRREDCLASMTFGPARLSFKLIEGNFPNYRQVIPLDFTSSCTFPSSIVPALVTWLRPHKDSSVKLTFGPNTVTLTVKWKDDATSTSVPALLSGPVPEFIAFNPQFLADALAMGLQTIDMNSEAEPGVLTDGITRYVLMPMRVTTAAAAPEGEADSDPPADEEPEDAEEPEEEPEEDTEPEAETDPADFEPGDAPDLFVEAYYDTLDGLDPDQKEYDRILAAWRAAGEPEDIATFILFRAAKPEPQDELPAAAAKPAKKSRAKRSAV